MTEIKHTQKILIISNFPETEAIYNQALTVNKDRFIEKIEIDFRVAPIDILDAYKAEAPAIIIIEIENDETQYLDIFKQIREHNQFQSYTGMIAVTDSSIEIAAKSLEHGADDFCCKTRILAELVARVHSLLHYKKNTEALTIANERLKIANEKLTRLTITDELTGLYNMRYFKNRLEQEFLRAERYDKFLSIIMIDIDNFKSVNDTNDHLMGSFVLAELGKIIATKIRTVDIAARFGGDEYVIMLPETGISGAHNAAKRIAQGTAATLFDNGRNQMKVTMSVGIATYGPGSEVFENGTELLRRADHYLYEAKETGRNKIVDIEHSVRNKKGA
ncbi:MAG: diguanylate cyclase [Bdellovibrionota bacterium]